MKAQQFDPKPYCENAVKIAETFERNFTGSDLDVVAMEEILGIIHKAYSEKEVTEQNAKGLAISMGVYLGQLMLDHKLTECGYAWKVDDNEPCLVKNSNDKMYPLTKVWKRVVNGKDDNVKSFYTIGIMMAEDKK